MIREDDFRKNFLEQGELNLNLARKIKNYFNNKYFICIITKIIIGIKMSLDYSKNDFNKNIKPLLEKELFNNGSIIEVIKYLEKDYNNEKYYFPSNEEIIGNEINEKILLDLNNELINKYLIRYCKCENTFYYLLQLDETLINQAIFNLNIVRFNSFS